MSGSAKPPLERLLRGISTNHVETVRDAWRALLADGAPSVPAVLDKLDSAAWKDRPRGPTGPYLGLLLALLDELDPAAFVAEIDRLQRSKLHPMHRLTVEMMARRATDAPIGRIGPGIPVFVAPEIEDRDAVLARLTRWSRVTGLDLASVTRVDVIARRSDHDYLGRYNLFFSGIILNTPSRPYRGLRGWLDRIEAEHTFYHEVGHHACGHLEGGQVAEQEREANVYARRMFRRAHPVATAVLYVPSKLLSLLIRLVVPKRTLVRAGVIEATD